MLSVSFRNRKNGFLPGLGDLKRNLEVHHVCVPSTSKIHFFSRAFTSVLSLTSSIATRSIDFYRTVPQSTRSSLFTMSPASVAHFSGLSSRLIHLPDIDSHCGPSSEMTPREPTSHGPGTTYYYCCQCRHGPQVFTHNPHCSYCPHRACGYCTYKKW